MGKIVDKVGTKHFYAGKLICHLVETFRKFAEFPGMFYVDLSVEVSICYCVDRMDEPAYRTQREITECQRKDHSDQDTDDPCLDQKGNERRAGAPCDQPGIYACDHDGIADQHGQKQQDKNKASTEQNDWCV